MLKLFQPVTGTTLITTYDKTMAHNTTIVYFANNRKGIKN